MRFLFVAEILLALFFLYLFIKAASPLVVYALQRWRDAEKKRAKTRADLEKELQVEALNKQLDAQRQRRFENLTDHLDGIFDDAKRGRPDREIEH